MIALLQRVAEASVSIDAECVASIGSGLLVLACVERDDDQAVAERICERLLNYRIFSDTDRRMNLSVMQAAGDVLLVPQFTLAADTSRGRRPGLGSAAKPAVANALFDHLCNRVEALYRPVGRGVFGADMQVALVNDGPVTFWLQV